MKKKAEKEIRPYEQDSLAKVPSWIKILLLKYWAAAAAFYFFAVGAAGLWSHGDDLDVPRLILLMMLALALFNNFLVRPIVRLMKNSRDDTFRYNMVNVKGTKSFFLNLLYGIVIMFPLEKITDFLGRHNLLPNPFGMGNDGIDPFMFALLYILLDFIAMVIKHLSINIYRKYKYKDSE